MYLLFAHAYGQLHECHTSVCILARRKCLPTNSSPMSPTTTVQDTSNETFVDKKMEQAYGAKLIKCVHDGVETR